MRSLLLVQSGEFVKIGKVHSAVAQFLRFLALLSLRRRWHKVRRLLRNWDLWVLNLRKVLSNYLAKPIKKPVLEERKTLLARRNKLVN